MTKSDLKKAPKVEPYSIDKTLEILPTLLGMDVLFVLRASLVRMGVDLIFAKWKNAFRCNPANTLTYIGLRALEDQGVVGIYETLKDKNRLFTLPKGLRRILELKHHRHAVSHPRDILWDTPEMQAFAKQRRHWTDLRAAIVLDLVRSLDEERVAHGLDATEMGNASIVPEMAAQESLILRFSLNADSLTAIPSDTEMIKAMEESRSRWLAFLAERPDGQRRPKT